MSVSTGVAGNKTGTKLIIAAVLIAVLAIGWFFSTMKQIETTITVPPRGEALYNPLYALKLTLQKLDVPVKSRARLRLNEFPLGTGDVLVLSNDVNTLSDDERSQLRDFVLGGGSLVVGASSANAKQKAKNDNLLTDLGIFTKEIDNSVCPKLATFDTEAEAYCVDRQIELRPGWSAEPKIDWRFANEKDSYSALRLKVDQGYVIAFADLSVLRSMGMQAKGKAEFVAHLLEPILDHLINNNGTVHLVYRSEARSLLALIVDYAKPVVLALLLALLAWLWMRSVRIGPLQQAPALDQQSLLAHLRAAGEFGFRNKLADKLLASYKNHVWQKLQRRDPSLTGLSERVLMERLVATGKLTPEQALHIAQPQDPQNREQFLRVIQYLRLL